MYGIYYLVPSLWNVVILISIFILFSRIKTLKDSVNSLEDSISPIKPSDSITTKTDAINNNISKIDPNYIIGDPIPQSVKPLSISELSKPVIKEAQQTFKTKSNDGEDQVINWLKENLLLKIGVVMIILGAGWFVSYAFVNNWISPVGRITLGVITGAFVTLFGTFRFSKDKTQGNAFTVLGTAIIIMSLLAGQSFYNFFTPTVVLLFIFIVSLYISMTAIAYEEERLAIYGMLISLLAPILSGTADMDMVLLYMYLAVTSIASIWISIIKSWKNILLIGITGILMYSLTNIFGGVLYKYDYKYIILFTTYLISIFYMLVGIWSMIKHGAETDTKDAYTTIVNSVLIIGFTLSIIPTVYQSLTLALWVLAFAFTGFFVFSRTKNMSLFYLHSCIAILLLALATSIELSGKTLIIAFAIEAAIITVASFIVTNDIKVTQRVGALMIIPGLMSLPSLVSSSWRYGEFILHSDFFVLFIMMALTGLLGVFYYLNTSNTKREFNSTTEFMFIVSSFYMFSLIWLCSHSLIMNPDSAVFLSLFVYTTIGLSTHFYGLFNQHTGLKKYGMIVLILVIARLILVDVWNMELLLRVVTFVVLGVMFISTTFISKNQNGNLIKS
jgi:uncharacterized membrane protein